jgi:hypothetical protein
MRNDLGLAGTAAKEAKARLEMVYIALEVCEAEEKYESCQGRYFSIVHRLLQGATAEECYKVKYSIVRWYLLSGLMRLFDL